MRADGRAASQFVTLAALLDHRERALSRSVVILRTGGDLQCENPYARERSLRAKAPLVQFCFREVCLGGGSAAEGEFFESLGFKPFRTAGPPRMRSSEVTRARWLVYPAHR